MGATAPDDPELIERFRSRPDGDPRAFEELVRRYGSRVVANCRYLTRTPRDSEDLAQEVFLKVYFGLRRFEGRSSFQTWLRRIKANHCLNYLKSRASRTFVELDDRFEVPPEAERTERSLDERARIGRVLDSLNDTLRVPLILRDMDELSYQEIADTLGIGLSAVKMRIKRAREEFRATYERLRDESERSER